MNITLTDIEKMSIKDKKETILKLELYSILDRMSITEAKCLSLKESIDNNILYCEVSTSQEIATLAKTLSQYSVRELASEYLTAKLLYIQSNKEAKLEAEIAKAKEDLAKLEADLLIIKT